MVLLTIISLSLMFGVIVASAWSIDNPESVKEYIGYVAGKEKVSVGMALAIAKAESNFNKDAKNPVGTASGIFQFLDSTFRTYCINKYRMTDTMEQKNNPFIQTNCAIEMLKEPQGYMHWFASFNGWG